MRTLALGIVATIVLAGCGSGGDQPPTEMVIDDHEFSHATESLCEARDAIDDSIGPSWEIFQNQAHDGLHELARQVTERNREVAAALLEAKQRVEVAFVKDMNAKAFRKLMSELLDASNTALEELSLATVVCP